MLYKKIYQTLEIIFFDPLTQEQAKRAFSIDDNLKHYLAPNAKGS